MTKGEKIVAGVLAAAGAAFGIKKWLEAREEIPPECATDADCPTGYVCIEGKCVLITPTPAVKLELEWHSGPTFEPGSIHSASVTVENPTDWYWEYDLELFVAGTSLESQWITLGAHTSKSLTWENIAMPSIEGEYPVHILVTCTTTGESLGEFPFESIVIVSPFDPWVYDVNDNGYIDYVEMVVAHSDWASHKITEEQKNEVEALYDNYIRKPGAVSAPDITISPAEWTS